MKMCLMGGVPGIFISYSNQDEWFTRFLHRHLTAEGLSVFMAWFLLSVASGGARQYFRILLKVFSQHNISRRE